MKKILLLLSLALVLTACDKSPSSEKLKSPPVKSYLVETITVERIPQSQIVVRTGTLRARHETRIINQEEGRLIDLPYYEGDHVSRGTILFRLDDTILQAELKKSIAHKRQAKQDLQRIERLKRSKAVSEDELVRARTELDVAQAEEDLLRIRLSNTYMKAPFDGVVTTRQAEPGDVLARFKQILTLTNPDSLVTEVSISELLLPTLTIDDSVEVTIDALPGRSFPGKISRIHPTIDPATRLGIVEITLKPAPQGVMPGQLCRVTLTGSPVQRLLIPFNALQRDAQGEYLYLVDNNSALKLSVESGAHFGEQVEIIRGLKDGQQVVTKGYYDLRPGVPVQVVSSVTGEQKAQ